MNTLPCAAIASVDKAGAEFDLARLSLPLYPVVLMRPVFFLREDIGSDSQIRAELIPCMGNAGRISV